MLKYLGNVGFNRLDDLNGMYAFAFYSKSENKLYFSRDRLGKKPLYVTIEGISIRWSSTVESLESPNTPNVISDEALVQYLSLGYLIDPTCTKSNNFAVKPGEILCVDLVTSQVVTSIISSPKIENGGDTLRGSSLREVIANSVEDRVFGHNKVAISLSGGVDSSIVAIEVAKKSGNAFAFTARWSDSDKERYNFDADVAERVCSKLNLKIEQVEMIKASELVSELTKFLTTLQEPNNNPSGVSMLRLYSRIAESGHRLALTGDGSDEIFGGYARHTAVSRVRNILNIGAGSLITKSFADVHESRTPLYRRAIGTQISPASPFSWLQWHWIFTPREIVHIFNEKSVGTMASVLLAKSVLDLDKKDHHKNPESLMRRDHEIWLAMESNRKLDRISMHYSIEARSPFQDDRVVGWANSYMKSNKYKRLSKEVLWREYPELSDLGVRKDKAGFTSPVGHWLRSNPNLVKSSLDYLSRDNRFNKGGLNFYRDAPQRGQYRELMQLWTLVVLATWLQIEK